MKRFIGFLFAVLVVVGLCISPVHALSTDDFTISSFEADYYLSRTAEQTSQLKIEEVIVAQFPDTDQNHGILRAIPETYQDHPLNIKVEAVTDGEGNTLQYKMSHENDNIILKIGDPDKYVHGSQTYKIIYTMLNVTQNLGDHDELYWDVNGTQWRQPFQKVVARLHVTDDIASKLQERMQCFVGAQHDTGQSCTINREGNVTTIAAARVLAAGETMTFVVGFHAGTFAAYKMPLSELLLIVSGVLFLGILPPIIALVVAIRNWRRSGRDPKGRGTIVPEYLPPKDISVLMASAVHIEDFKPVAVSATIIDLAVRHYLKVYEQTEKKLFKDKFTYELELVREPADLHLEERQILTLLFGDNLAVGDKKQLGSSDKSAELYKKVQEIGKNVTAQAATEGYFIISPDKARVPYIGWGIGLMVVGFFVIPYGLGLIAAGIILGIASGAMPRRTEKGVVLRDYIKGLEVYMKLAEAERLKVLQSPHGTLTEKIDTGDNKALVKLYEKLLPYAMLLGIEKDWAKQFAHLYTESPDWYVSNNAFNAAFFVSSLHNFGATTTASFNPPSDSSSSGFGGGFAGGGGGGGGGGGW